MLEPVLNVIQRVVISAETHITLVIKPDLWWVVILNAHPLPDVELLSTNEQWVLNVLLNHELTRPATAVGYDIVKVIVTADASTSG